MKISSHDFLSAIFKNIFTSALRKSFIEISLLLEIDHNSYRKPKSPLLLKNNENLNITLRFLLFMFGLPHNLPYYKKIYLLATYWSLKVFSKAEVIIMTTVRISTNIL